MGSITFLFPAVAPRVMLAPPVVFISMTVESLWRYGLTPLPLIQSDDSDLTLTEPLISSVPEGSVQFTQTLPVSN